MIKVTVRPNEPLEAALRRFKRQCNYAGIFRLAKKYSFYEKRSDKNRREERERIRNIQRAMRKLEQRGKPKSRRKSKIRANRPEAEEERTDEKQSPQAASKPEIKPARTDVSAPAAPASATTES